MISPLLRFVVTAAAAKQRPIKQFQMRSRRLNQQTFSRSRSMVCVSLMLFPIICIIIGDTQKLVLIYGKIY